MYCTNYNFIKNKWLYFCIGGKRLQQTWILCTCALTDHGVTVTILKQELQQLLLSWFVEKREGYNQAQLILWKYCLGKAVCKTCWICIKKPQLYQIRVTGWQKEEGRSLCSAWIGEMVTPAMTVYAEGRIWVISSSQRSCSLSCNRGQVLSVLHHAALALQTCSMFLMLQLELTELLLFCLLQPWDCKK